MVDDTLEATTVPALTTLVLILADEIKVLTRTVPAVTALAAMLADVIKVLALSVPTVIPEENVPVADWIAPDKLKLPPVTVFAIIVPTVTAFALMFADVTLDAATAPVMFALAAVIPVADWIAPDKLKLPPVTVLAITVPTVALDAAMLADVIRVVALSVPTVIPEENVPVADWIAPDKLKLPTVMLVAITFPTVALDADTLADVTLDAATAPIMFALAAVIPVADWIAPDKLMLPPVIVDAITVPTVALDAAMLADEICVPTCNVLEIAAPPRTVKLPPVPTPDDSAVDMILILPDFNGL